LIIFLELPYPACSGQCEHASIGLRQRLLPRIRSNPYPRYLNHRPWQFQLIKSLNALQAHLSHAGMTFSCPFEVVNTPQMPRSISKSLEMDLLALLSWHCFDVRNSGNRPYLHRVYVDQVPAPYEGRLR
jgi:hypothetical protein